MCDHCISISEKMDTTFFQTIMLIYVADICGHGIYPFYRRFLATQPVSQNNDDFAEDTVHIMQSRNKEPASIFSTVEVVNADMMHPTNSNIFTCHDIVDQTKIVNLDDGIAQGHSDIDISYDDLVQLQYLQLPYPTIRHDTIEMEYKYYLGQNSKYPVSSQYSLKLEYLNHYLYQGQDNFEYVLI